MDLPGTLGRGAIAAMRIFRHTRPGREGPLDEAGEELRRTVTSVVFYDDADADATVRLDRRAQLRRIVAEAVVLQDKAVEVLADIRDREPLAEMASRGGPVARRFFELRRQLPPPADGEMARQCETAGVLLDHHGTLIVQALELLAGSWRSQAVVAQLERLDGLGAPAERLDALYSELSRG
jgi:hypothetical protein